MFFTNALQTDQPTNRRTQPKMRLVLAYMVFLYTVLVYTVLLYMVLYYTVLLYDDDDDEQGRMGVYDFGGSTSNLCHDNFLVSRPI